MNEATILYRATMELRSEGRTLLGLAVPWDTPATVQDPGGPPYLEAFSSNTFTRSLDNHKDRPFPLFKAHGWKRGEDPIGTTTFTRSTEGLLYVAPLSRTRAADEALELVNDKALLSASLGYEVYKSRQAKTRAGMVTVRTEAALMELSLAATGFGMFPQAGTLAVRAELEELEENNDEPQGTPRRDALRKELARLDTEPGRKSPSA